jgi:hypothetical protein
MKYLAYLVMNNGEEGEGDSDLLRDAIRWLELRYPGEKEEDVLKMFAKKSPPRLFCTHLYFRFLQKQVLEDKAKTIVVMRNPKDVLVSFYHLYKIAPDFCGNYSGTWDDFFELFKEKPLRGNALEHNAEWWKVRDLDNVLVIKYEEMKGSSDKWPSSWVIS